MIQIFKRYPLANLQKDYCHKFSVRRDPFFCQTFRPVKRPELGSSAHPVGSKGRWWPRAVKQWITMAESFRVSESQISKANSLTTSQKLLKNPTVCWNPNPFHEAFYFKRPMKPPRPRRLRPDLKLSTFFLGLHPVGEFSMKSPVSLTWQSW